MNRAAVQKHLPLLLAFAEGKDIQFMSLVTHKWTDLPDPSWDIGAEYRVKPEKTFVFVLYADQTRWLSLYDVTEAKANSIFAQESSLFPNKSFKMDKFKKVEGEQAK